MTRSFPGGGGGASKQATFSGSAQDAYNQAVRAIQQSGGEVQWQQAPNAARFLLSYKNFWTTGGVVLKYDGDLAILPAGPGQTTARFGLKVQWNSALPLILLQGLAVIVLAMVNPYVMYFALIIIALTLAYTAWNVSSGVPEKTLELIVKNLQTGGAAPVQAPQQPYSPPAPQPPVYTPPAAPPTPAPQPAPADNTAAIVEQIKQLAGLRDAGAITADEFEAKKAELLKRI
ncbi:SHOCT domain-containing protein [Terricaulis sp.]|uniref:SHOCT domain-containing protein n=1 Tax=Terricaulis sp. TaxID=2768686 RepID=UPI003782E0B2